MLRVSNISFENHSKSKINSKEANVNTHQPSPIAYNTVPSWLCINTTAKSLITFKGAGFDKTLEDNYFKLPKGCKPDKYQENAAMKLFYDKDVLVTAPTGTGKTAIAHYVITKNMEEGKKTFYTTPLKALSNEKYRQMQAVYGKENVGLMTGDVKINTKAPIVIMTTEIYRNMVFGDKFKMDSDKEQLKDLKTVIFDELHYLGDVDRGGVWEQSIILTDPKTQILSLSATIGNNLQINDWMSSVKGKKSHLEDVPAANRHVPLVFENVRVEAKSGGRGKKAGGKNKADSGADPYAAPDTKAYQQMVDRLYQKDRLPAIFFVFSKKVSKDLLSNFAESGTLLTSKNERQEIEAIVDKYKNNGKYLGESLNMEALEKGYAIHNSGLLPAQKELTEELFQKKLVKVVLATETLAAGINMPARTTVISSTIKPASDPAGLLNVDKNDPIAEGQLKLPEGKRELTANQFHQMSGRAGRRGMDKIGYVYTMSTSTPQMKKFESLINEEPNKLVSNFKPDFSFVSGYYKMTKDDEIIDTVLKKSLFAYDKSTNESAKKYQKMVKLFETQKDVLTKFGFMKKGNDLTEKGELLSLLNGYHQIPVIDAIHSKRLSDLNPVELAACVGSLANINDKTNPKAAKFKKEPEFFEHENVELKDFVADFDDALVTYNEKRADEFAINSEGKRVNTFKKIEQNKDVAKHIYAWADLNSKSDSGRDNWKELYKGDLAKSIRDEGSLFKEIIQTVDLLKQISTISEEALKITDSAEDQIYYTNLKSTIAESIKLLKKEPIVDAE